MRSKFQEDAYLDGSLSSALERIQYLIKTYGPNAGLENEGEMYDESGRTHLKVYAMEPETDQEMAKRIADEERYEALSETRDRSEYERLKGKFEK